ncbi:MAG: metallophosphatase [Sphingobacteriaceae bacterium]|jgi:predicted MPP superfamily phosphohydrolase|nr:metallophosphatase [Sphingobacteriaceae bacterium]
MLNRLPFLIIISVLLLLLDFYLYKALLAVFPKLRDKYRRSFSRIWWGYSALLLLGVFSSIFFSIPLVVRAITLVAFFISFVSKVVLLIFVLFDDLRRLVLSLFRRSASRKPEPGTDNAEKIPRSEFLVKAGIAVASVPFASIAYGVASGAYDYQLRREALYLKNLPRAFEGMKLGQISDVHSGSFYNKRAVTGGVDMLLAEKPDVIFFTGDIVNNIASEMRDYQDIFSKVKAPLGVFSVLGNHDYGDYYYGKEPSAAKAKNLENVKKIHGLMGWDLLLDEHRRLKVNNEEIGILGCQNWGAGRFIQKGDLVKTLKGTDDLPVKLLMSHDPSHWRAQILNHPDIDATFSGHTHGMQFGVRTKEYQWSPVEYIYKEWAGFYREGHQQLYVNVGYGFLGYPGRVGILPEITIFELKRG